MACLPACLSVSLAQQEPSLAIKLGVAFNPFLPDADELRREQERLKVSSRQPLPRTVLAWSDPPGGLWVGVGRASWRRAW